MKTVLYSVPQGYFARNLLRTGVPELLLKDKDLRIVILSPAHKDEQFVKDFSFNNPNVFHEPLYDYNVYKHSNRLESLIWKLCYFSWYKIRNRFLHLMFCELRELYFQLFSPSLYDEVFKKYKPDLVITSTTGITTGMDIAVTRKAKREKIKTLCLVHSWDNIAGAKGILFIRPDFMGVWNELQKKEAVELHFYDPKKVFIVGPVNFDIYYQRNVFIDREQFLKKMGLDPNKRLVTFTEATMNSTENTYILDILLDAIKKGKFGESVQLLCRLHPRRKFERSKETYVNYFDNPLIKFDNPGGYHEVLKWYPDRTQMLHLANTIKHSDVIINVASTITIEAAILDTPVINMGFSSSEPERFKYWIKDLAWKYHFSYVRERDCSHIAKDADDLVNAINMYLERPQTHQEGRSRLAHDICFKLDGKSTERVAKLIRNLLRV